MTRPHPVRDRHARAPEAHASGARASAVRVPIVAGSGLLARGALRVTRGECVAVHGAPPTVVELLWRLAGLRPRAPGQPRWLSARGRTVPPPPRAFVSDGWRAYECWTVRDALEAAVPAGTGQLGADRLVDRVRTRCLPELVESAPVVALGPGARWRLGVATAVARGARWLLLRPPTALPVADHAPVRAALRRLLGAGVTIVGAEEWPGSRTLPASRRIWIPAWRDLEDVVGRTAGGRTARVAEGGARAAPASGSAASVDSPSGAP